MQYFKQNFYWWKELVLLWEGDSISWYDFTKEIYGQAELTEAHL